MNKSPPQAPFERSLNILVPLLDIGKREVVLEKLHQLVDSIAVSRLDTALTGLDDLVQLLAKRMRMSAYLVCTLLLIFRTGGSFPTRRHPWISDVRGGKKLGHLYYPSIPTYLST